MAPVRRIAPIFIRIVAILVILPTLAMLWVHAANDGIETVYFLLPDIGASLALLAAAIHGGRGPLLAAFALACGVFMTATLGPLWIDGLAATPPGAAAGFVTCLVVIGFLVRGK